MYTYWEQLVLLQIYARALKTGHTDLKDVILTDKAKNYMEIIQEIRNLLEVQGLSRIPPKKKTQKDLNMDDLRREDLPDRLWNILICRYTCKTFILLYY